MIIREVETVEEAKVCDGLLFKLILDEKRFNENIGNPVAIMDYYPNIYNKDENKLFIALDGDKIVGYIFIKTFYNKGIDINKDALIDALFVEEEYRNHGVATSLINKVKEYTKANGIKYISINVLNDNTVAKELYKKLGFNLNSLGLKYKND